MRLVGTLVIAWLVYAAAYIGLAYVAFRMVGLKSSWKKALVCVLVASIFYGIFDGLAAWKGGIGGVSEYVVFMLAILEYLSSIVFLRMTFGARRWSIYIYITAFFNGMIAPSTCLIGLLSENATIMQYLQDRISDTTILALTVLLMWGIGLLVIECVFRTRLKKNYVFLVETPGVCLKLAVGHLILYAILSIVLKTHSLGMAFLWSSVNMALLLISPVIAREYVRRKKLREGEA